MTSKTQQTATNNTEKNPITMGHYSTTPNTNMRQLSNFRHWYQTTGIMMHGLISTLRTLGQFTVTNKHRKPALLMRCVFVLLMMGGMGASAQVNYFSKAAATDFTDVNSWGTAANGTGASPAAITDADNYTIANGAVMNLNTASASVRTLTINTGSLTVGSNTLTVSIASAFNSNLTVNSGGALTVTGGNIVVNGNILFAASSTFNQSNGLITVDGNNGGSTTGSVAAATPLVEVRTSLGTVNGGTMTIVDPPASGSAVTFEFNLGSGAGTPQWGGHTLRLGNGVSTDASTNTTGFQFDTYFGSSSTQAMIGNLIVDGGSGTNRWATSAAVSFDGSFVKGDITINAGSELRDISGGAALLVAGNIVNNGTLSKVSTALNLSTFLGATASASPNAQTISGTGVFRNSLTTPTANFATLIINNSNATGVTFSNANSLTSGTNTGTVSGTFTLTAGRINTSGLNFVLGVSTTTLGSLSYTAGGFTSNSTFGRWYAAGTAGTTITGSTLPTVTGTTGSYPFLVGANARNFFINRPTTAGATGGVIRVSHTDGAGLNTIATVADGAYNIDRQSVANWTVSTSNGFAAGTGTFSYAASGQGVYAAANTNTRLMLVSSVVGTHQAGTALPHAQRTTIPAASAFGTFYMGISSADLPITSNQSGPWEDPATWVGAVVPTSASGVVIASPHVVTVNAAAAAAGTLTVSSGATLTVSGNTLSITGAATTGVTNNGTVTVSGGTIEIGSAGNNNRRFTNVSGASLTISSGNLNLFGNAVISNNSNYTQSGGTFSVDGNNAGSITNSVLTGTHLFSIGTSTTNYSTGTINLSGGSLVIVDPHAATAGTDWVFVYYGTATPANNITTTGTFSLQFGDGVSTDAGGSAVGFFFNQWEINGGFKTNFVINSAAGTNRSIVSSQYSPFIAKSITVLRGDFRAPANTVIEGNLTATSPGIYTASTTTTFGAAVFSGSSIVSSANNVPQTIGGTGTVRNSATAVTANLIALTINNSDATAVTLNGTDISLSGALTFTLGKVFTGANKLVLTSAGSVTGAGQATGYVVGSLQKNVATGTNVARTFEVGGTNSYAPATVTFASVTAAGNLVVGTTSNDHPSLAGSGLRADKTVNRFWTATNAGITFTTYALGLAWQATDNDAGLTAANLKLGKFNTATWTLPAVSGTPTATSITSTNSITSFSDFAVAEECITPSTPVITGPICPGATSVSGTSAEIDGTIIQVFIDAVSAGTTTVTANAWTLAVPALSAGNTITATATTTPSLCVSAIATITVGTAPAVTSVTGGNTYCTGDVVADIQVAVTGGGPWTVSYTLDGNPLTATGGTSPISLGNAAGVYVVTGIQNASCSATATGTQTITINPVPTVTSVTGGAAYCTGQTAANIEVAVTGTGPWTVSYTLDGNPLTATGGTSPISLGNAAGVYVVTGVQTGSCSNTASGTQTISFDAAPTANAGADITSCVSGLPVFTVTGAIGGSATTATWSTDGGGSFSSTTWDGLGQTYTPAGSDLTGTFPKLITITLTTNAAGICAGAVDNLVITLNQVPDLVTTPGSFCSGGSVDLSTLVTDNNSTTGTLAYYSTLTDAQNETAAISSVVSSASTYYIRKNTTTTPSCDDIESVVVTQLPDYTITATAGSNGAITPNGTTTLCSGGSQSYTITADACYHILNVLVDGVTNPGAISTGTYTFTNVTGNHTIDATFAISTYTLTYTAGAGGSISGTTPQTVNCGADGTTVTAVAAPGFHFVNWSDASTTNPRTDLAVNADISVTANFQINCPAVAHNVNQNTDHCTIQEAVDAANSGDVINVVAGTFTENVLVNEEVTLNGAGSGLTRINSVTTNGNIMTVTANNVTISNMQLEGTLVSGSSATRGIYINSAISNLHVTNVLSSLHQFALFVDNNADVTGLVVLNSTFTASGNGIQVQHTGKVSGLSITGGAITDNLYGFASNAQYQVASVNVNNQSGLTGVTVTGTTFSGNLYKGLYFEKLDNAIFDNITVTGNGLDNTGTLQESGFDINLKFGTYSNIEIRNSTISGNATTNDNGAGLVVKARTVGGGGTYGLNPATLNTVSIHHNNIVNNGGAGLYTSGIRIGESNNSVTGAGEAGPTGVEIHYNGLTGNTNFAIRNAATASVNATCNWFGTNNLTTISSMISMSPGTVTYIPHLTSGDNDLGTNGFQTTESCLACDPVIAGTYGPTCVESADITLVGSPAGGVWTGTGVSGDQVNGYTFDPSAGSQTLTYTYDGLNGCSGFDVTTITISPAPSAPATSNQTACEDGNAAQTLTATATAAGGSSVVWFDAATGGAIVGTPTQVGVGTVTYYAASQDDATGCYSLTRTAETLTINAAPAAPTASNQTACEDGSPGQTLTATATAAGGSSVVWYNAAMGGAIVGTPTQVGVGTVTYYAASQGDITGCYSLTRTAVTLTINPAPSAPTASGTQEACSVSVSSLNATATAPAGSSVVWYDAATAGSVITPSQVGVGTSTYYAASQDNTTGCYSLTRTAVTVTIYQTPAAPSIAVVNNHNGTSTLTAGGLVPGASLLWSTTQTVNPIVVNATNTYTVTQTANGCVSAQGSAFVVPDIFADPAVTGMDITDMSDVSLNANTVGLNQVVKLKLPVFNLSQDNFIPAHSTTLRIDLGTKFVVDPGFTLASAPLNTYFAWTETVSGGHVVIIGDQIADLPADFDGTAVFQLNGTTSCTSLISANFQVDNHLSSVFLVDEDVLNNTSTLQYTVIVPAPTVTLVQPTCATATGSITITAPMATGMTYSINGVDYTNTTGLFILVAPGSYSVRARTADGCTSAATLVTIDPQPLTPTITLVSVNNNTCHGGTTGVITVTAGVAPTPYTYTIAGPTVNTTGELNGIFTGLAAGSYTITVLSASGCSNSIIATVSEPAGTNPNLSLGSDFSNNFFGAIGVENTVLYNIAEVDGNAAVGDTLRISKVAGYTLTFNTATTTETIDVTPVNVDNQRWKVDYSNPSYVSIIFDPAHNSSPGMLNCGEIVYLSVQLTRNTPNISTFSLSARLRKANGEVDLTNNLNSIVFTAE